LNNIINSQLLPNYLSCWACKKKVHNIFRPLVTNWALR
jgi:hypothetical protein